jgi:hypothetical protein
MSSKARPPEPCKRSDGSTRAWFYTRQEAEAFEADPRNFYYCGDIAHLCGKCDLYHLSRPEWLEPKFNDADCDLLAAMGIAV